MSNARVAVIYYSTYGHNHQMAEVAADAAKAAGAEVRLRKVRETAPPAVIEGQAPWKAHVEATAHVQEASTDDMEWANAYFFSCPTRFGVVASQLRVFIDTLGPIWAQGKLANKAVTAMTSALNAHGGQETTLISLYTTMMHWGAIIVPPGYSDPSLYAAGGNPYGVSLTAGNDPIGEESKTAIRYQAKRLVEFAEKLAR
ncbi:MAG: flavoprotein WrbA [Gemmatimonadetes bacterium]|nr:flavoprotein WrbA [Gemmatimonadota bacterium]